MSNNMFFPQSKYGLSAMKDEEGLLFADVCLENGAEPAEAILDMKLIDALLHAKKLYIAVKGSVTKTKAGHLRKNSTLYDTFDALIEGRLNDGR